MNLNLRFIAFAAALANMMSAAASADGDRTAAPVSCHSGTLPVLYVNVYDENGDPDNEIISMDLAHKDYFSGEYWLETGGLDLPYAATDLGSRENPLPLEIKARGNWTRTGFSKKPFKLKLGKKQSMLGMSKSKHYVILAHADDTFGYLRNFTGFGLGHILQLPWTPTQQPIEVYINGDYRGIYFLTESIRVEENRINIAELEDNETDWKLCSGGYLVELDNYKGTNHIVLEEKSCSDVPVRQLLRVTFDTPEEYSDIQKKFITEQFTTMNDLVGANSNELWSYMDLDDAVRYYLVEEIIGHLEAYQGSTYLFRDFGEGEKWHFSPIWDCGHAFEGPTDDFFFRHSLYGTTWIPSLWENGMFQQKLQDTWLWFLSQEGDKRIVEEMTAYAESLQRAADADRKRWKDEPYPYKGQPVADNTAMMAKLHFVVDHIQDKMNFLRSVYGDALPGEYGEPECDMTPGAPLPDYLVIGVDAVSEIAASQGCGEPVYYNMQGVRITTPRKGEPVIVGRGAKFSKEQYR